jgi:hypothetical protein
VSVLRLYDTSGRGGEDFLYIDIKGTPSGRARRPAPVGLLAGHGITGKGSEGSSGRPRRRGGGGRVLYSPPQAAAWPAASSAAAHRRGPLPPCGQPRTRPIAAPPSRTPGDRTCKSSPGGPPAPCSLTPRKEHNQGRTSSLGSRRLHLDSDLRRQRPAPVRRTGKSRDSIHS